MIEIKEVEESNLDDISAKWLLKMSGEYEEGSFIGLLLIFSILFAAINSV